jgi:hypothetical protein
VVVTEQYPKVFGATVAEFGVGSPDAPPAEGASGSSSSSSEVRTFAKRKFSMVTPDSEAAVAGYRVAGRHQAVLFGVEAHVCVQQTCLDLLEAGHEVHVLLDGVSSQRKFDRAAAIARMQQAGALVTTSESALFDMIGDSTHANFKAISGLVKTRPPHDNWD